MWRVCVSVFILGTLIATKSKAPSHTHTNDGENPAARAMHIIISHFGLKAKNYRRSTDQEEEEEEGGGRDRT